MATMPPPRPREMGAPCCCKSHTLHAVCGINGLPSLYCVIFRAFSSQEMGVVLLLLRHSRLPCFNLGDCIHAFHCKEKIDMLLKCFYNRAIETIP